MHGYFWNVEAFEVFESSHLWLFTDYLVGDQGYVLGFPWCVHAGGYNRGGTESWVVMPFHLRVLTVAKQASTPQLDLGSNSTSSNNCVI